MKLTPRIAKVTVNCTDLDLDLEDSWQTP